MGQEIDRQHFAEADYRRFENRLQCETALLSRWWEDARFDAVNRRVGYEVEAWLLDHHAVPVPDNQPFLAAVCSERVVPELSRFNVELNGDPQSLGPGALTALEQELTGTWQLCQDAAHVRGETLLLIGTLPTIRDQDLSLAQMSPLNRYRALNDQIMQARQGRPIRLRIEGDETLDLLHADVMLEAATTSLQLHLQVPAGDLVASYNASLVLSALTVGLAANSPFLFNRQLWAETRIPLFEQAVDTRAPSGEGLSRVSFGSGYLDTDPIDLFRENLRHAVLLPLKGADDPSAMEHLRLHNGTLWRWNRLLVGPGIRPHLRIEHRVMAAGPSLIDMVANAAFYFGLVHWFLHQPEWRQTASLAEHLPFAEARANFYRAARDGLAAELQWLDGSRVPLDRLIRILVPRAEEGLLRCGLEPREVQRLLCVIDDRARCGQNGAVWQRRHATKYQRDWQRLVSDYLEHQRSGMPVHEWTL